MNVPELYFSVSHTTRDRREGETDGVNYHFVGKRDFAAMVVRGKFVEHAEVHGEFYGTSGRILREKIESGIDVLLDIDVRGFLQLQASHLSEECGTTLTSVMILPQDIGVLEQRLADLGRNNIQKRLEAAEWEMSQSGLYSRSLKNWVGGLDTTVDSLWKILYPGR